MGLFLICHRSFFHHYLLAGPAHKRKRKGGQPSRKDARKQARDGRKQRKAEYFLSAPAHKIRRNEKRAAEADHADSPHRKKVKLDVQSEPRRASTSKPIPPVQDARQHPHAKPEKPKTALQKLAERSEAPKLAKLQSKSSLKAMLRTPQEEEEDAYIAYLERKLGWVKGGKRTVSYGMGDEDDGLGGPSVPSRVPFNMLSRRR